MHAMMWLAAHDIVQALAVAVGLYIGWMLSNLMMRFKKISGKADCCITSPVVRAGSREDASGNVTEVNSCTATCRPTGHPMQGVALLEQYGVFGAKPGAWMARA